MGMTGMTSTPETRRTARTTSDRFRSLDGLRGVAALVVMLDHTLLVTPALNDVGTRGDGWLVRSPLHLFWAGGEAVFVFFILSGVVLTLPVLRGSFDWAAYYPSRLVRLYLPVAASVVIAVVLAAVVVRVAVPGQSPWMAVHDGPLSAMGVTRDLVLLFGADALNSPLWSLQWEVLFSLLLPAYVWVAVRANRFWLPVLAGCVVLTLAGLVAHIGAVQYLPMFMIGVVLAVRLPELLERVAALLPGRRGWVVLVAALVAVTAHWWMLPVLPSHAVTLSLPLIMVGAAVLVVLAITWAPAVTGLSTAVPQWAGRISFSLYLTHEPIVVTVGQLLPVHLAWLTPVISIPIALAVAVGFFRFVEAPTHRLSQRIRRALRARGTTTVGAAPDQLAAP